MKTEKEVSEASSSESGSNQERKHENLLLEMASFDDLADFQEAVKNGACVDQPGEWYGRSIGTNKMGCEQRTPVMIASLYGSVNVLRFALMQFPHPEALVNQVCGSDSTTALHCAAASGSPHALQILDLLLRNGARCDARDALGRRPLDVVQVTPQTEHMKAALAAMLMDRSSGEMSAKMTVNAVEDDPAGSQIASEKGIDELLQLGFLLKNEGFVSDVSAESSRSLLLPPSPPKSSEKRPPSRDFAVDAALPDIKNSLYATDDFRMFSFKVLPCSRAYSHDWTECPFVHPGENARRRDPRKFNYSCAPCPDLRKGCCPKGDACGYAHGVFECWLHPAQYRTRLCKDGSSCVRRVCFFAHSAEELRPLCQSPSTAASFPRETISPPLPPLFPSRIFASPPPSPSLTAHYAAAYSPVWPQPLRSLGGLRTAMNLPNTSPEDLSCNFNEIFAEFSPTEATYSSSLGKTGNFSGSSLDLNVCHGQNSFPDPPSLPQLPRTHQSQIRLLPSLAASASSSSQSSAPPQSPVPNHSPLQPSATNKSLHSFSSLTITLPKDSSAASDIPENLPQRRSAHFSVNSQRNRHSKELSEFVPLSSWSEWGSPSGKPDWRVQRQDLANLGASPSLDPNATTEEATEPDLSWVQSLVKDSSADPD